VEIFVEKFRIIFYLKRTIQTITMDPEFVFSVVAGVVFVILVVFFIVIFCSLIKFKRYTDEELPELQQLSL
jgi:hypothetical protein